MNGSTLKPIVSVPPSLSAPAEAETAKMARIKRIKRKETLLFMTIFS